MNHADGFIAILMLTLMGTVLYCLWRATRGKISYVRRISGITAMEEAVGRATEMGQPILFVLGNSNIQMIETHTVMAVLLHVARLAAQMRTELVVLVSVPDVYPLAEATVRQAYMEEGAPELFNGPEQVRYLSDGVVFAAGVSRFVEEERPGCAIFFGTFDFISLLLTEPGARLGILQIAGDPSLFQMPFFVCTCDHTIIGEEFYAAGAYVSPDPKMRNSLLSQDLAKLIFTVIMVVGIVCRQFYSPSAAERPPEVEKPFVEKVVDKLKGY
ncbi:DUF6754 domain-containing protein [Candidatus Sumerlaeota bacterium]